jgi:hypothetical protein
VQRHLVLVAEPPRRHGVERQLLRRLALSKNLIAGAFGRRFCFGGFGPPSLKFRIAAMARSGASGATARLERILDLRHETSGLGTSHIFGVLHLSMCSAFDVTPFSSSGQNVIQISGNYTCRGHGRDAGAWVACLRAVRGCRP